MKKKLMFPVILFLVCGCASTSLQLEYNLTVPGDLPGKAQLDTQQGETIEVNPRMAYAYWHMHGWTACLERFICGDCDLNELDPELPAVHGWGYAAKGQKEGYKACQKYLLEKLNENSREEVVKASEKQVEELEALWLDYNLPYWDKFRE